MPREHRRPPPGPQNGPQRMNQPKMRARPRVLAWSLMAIAVTAGSAAIALSLLTDARVHGGLSSHGSAIGDAANLVGFLLAGLAGAVVVSRRAETRMGWLFLALAACAGIVL